MRLPYRMRSGSWQPARWLRSDHLLLMFGLVLIGFLRGLDYLIGDDDWGSRDFMIAAAPEWVWGGVGFLTGALILTYAIISRRHLFVYVGHWWLGISYGLNSLAAVLASGPMYSVPVIAVAGSVLLGLVWTVHRLSEKGWKNTAFLAVLLGLGAFAWGIYATDSFDGVRGGGAVGLVAVIHVLQAFRTGARPLRPGENRHERATSSQVGDV